MAVRQRNPKAATVEPHLPVSLVTPACDPWGIPGPFCCILNLTGLGAHSSATMWKSRDPSYLRNTTRKPWGREQGRKTQQHKTKQPSTQTHSPSLKFQLLLQRTEGNNKVWACFLSYCFDSWTKLGSFEPWALRWKMCAKCRLTSKKLRKSFC